jgi:hypothetical protein
MNHGLLESSHSTDSNGDGLASIGLIDVKLFNETLWCNEKLWFIGYYSASSDRKETYHGSLDSSCRTDSNGICFAPFGSIDVEIFDETSDGAVKK